MEPMPTSLFDPFSLGPERLPSRIVMAPMTRSRSSQPGDVPNATMAEYYAQRAGAGLIVTEATQISRQGQGYSFTPGIYSEAQVAGWRLVTDAVHAAGGRAIGRFLWKEGDQFVIDGVSIPQDQVDSILETGRYQFTPGPGKVIERWSPGDHTVVASWNGGPGSVDSGTLVWTFDVQ